jgi:hypothetical protein
MQKSRLIFLKKYSFNTEDKETLTKSQRWKAYGMSQMSVHMANGSESLEPNKIDCIKMILNVNFYFIVV